MVDAHAVCEAASQQQPNQALAAILSTLFMIYIVMAMLLSGLAILSASSPFLPLRSKALVALNR